MNEVSAGLKLLGLFAKIKSRKTLFVICKYFVLYFLPILLITNEVFKMWFGDYVLVPIDRLNFCLNNMDRTLLTFIAPMILFCIAYGMEQTILPLFGALTRSWSGLPVEKEIIRRVKGQIRKIIPVGEMKEMFRELKRNKVELFEVYVYVAFIPVTLILWTTWVSLFYSYHLLWLILIPLLLYWILAKAIRTATDVLSK